MEEQVCKKCGELLPLHDFPKHSNMKTGHLSTCKTCKGIYLKNYNEGHKTDKVWFERKKKRMREYMRKREKLPVTPEQRRERANAWRSRFPEKYASRAACNNMRKLKGKHFHHWSYREEHHFDIIPLTASMHRLAHRLMTYDQERMMYRRLDGTLIDSREAAIAYYATLKDE